jgi:hypothetical protein
VVLVVQALVQVVMVVVLNKQARQEQQEVDILVQLQVVVVHNLPQVVRQVQH